MNDAPAPDRGAPGAGGPADEERIRAAYAGLQEALRPAGDPLPAVRRAARRRRRAQGTALAVAAVSVLAAGTAVAVTATGTEDSAPGPAAPTAVDTATGTPAPAPTSDVPDPQPTRPPATSPGSCGSLRPTRDAEELGAAEIGDTTVRVYEKGDRWFVCDEWAALDGGDATLFPEHPVGQPLQRDHLGISMNYSMDQAGVGEYVAGGALPDDSVASISYTFPDGHVEDAVVEGGVWAMAYFATTSPLDGSRRVPMDAETTVTVGYADGTEETFDLEYPLDYCSQTNHGC